MKRIFLMASAIVIAMSLSAVSCTKDDGKKDDDSITDVSKEPEASEEPGESTDPSGNADPSTEPSDGFDGSEYACLGGEKYIPVILQKEVAEYLGGKIMASFAPDDKTSFNYYWNGIAPQTPSALGFFGFMEGWAATVTTGGWSGGGYWVSADHEWTDADGTVKKIPEAAAVMADDPDHWYFHIAYRVAAGHCSLVVLHWGGKEYQMCLGEGSYDGVAALVPASGKFVANEWNEFEVSVAETGFNFKAEMPVGEDGRQGENVLTYHQGAEAGNVLELDAAFYYKK